MARPKLKAKSKESPVAGAERSIPVEGVVVKKEHLVEVLRAHLPQLADIQAFEDGERFFLVFSQSEQHMQSQ